MGRLIYLVVQEVVHFEKKSCQKGLGIMMKPNQRDIGGKPICCVVHKLTKIMKRGSPEGVVFVGSSHAVRERGCLLMK